MILVTGATGFLGKHIVKALLEKGEDLRILVRNSTQRELPWGSLVEVVDGHINDPYAVYKAMEDIDKVVHVAALVSFWKKRKKELMKVNVEGTANVVNAALEHKVSSFVHVSSIAALGRNKKDTQPIDEQTPWKPSKNISDYARSKYESELEVYRGIAEGLHAIMINPGLILGPDSNWAKGTAKFFPLMEKGLRFYNKGLSGVVSVEDVAQVVAILLEKEVDSGERFVLVAKNMEQKELFGQIARSVGSQAPTIGLPSWISMLVGYVSTFISLFTRREPLITPDTMRSSISRFRYNGEKITHSGFSYSPIEELIQSTGERYLLEKSKN